MKSFKGTKQLAERAIEQVNWEEMHYAPDKESNSIAVIMKHVAGNMFSRWTDFLTSDGEKADRHRDYEFVPDNKSKDEILKYWNGGWQCLFDTLSSLTEDDLQRTVFIRNEAYSVFEALIRQVSHYSYHTGQIAFLAKLIKSEKWKTLSIPRGKSEEFNKSKFNK